MNIVNNNNGVANKTSRIQFERNLSSGFGKSFVKVNQSNILVQKTFRTHLNTAECILAYGETIIF